MKPEDFELISGMLKERSGLALSQDKVYLVESRLTPLARKRGFGCLDELVREIRTRRDERLLRDVTEAMTTNESFFFRDAAPFDLFRDVVIPELLRTRDKSRKLRVWCAAASTGQEPYSLAMILREMQHKLQGRRIEIIGTDLSAEVLQKARVGLYSQFEVQRGLPIQMMIKYFSQVGEMWQIDSSLRAMVRFEELNLLKDFSRLGKFDVIYCRNVLIYFDHETKARVLDRIRKMMPGDGVLFLGAAETVLGVCDKFKPVAGQRGLYAPV
ncbi:MAG: CheR family methyltransferase [Sphingomonadales bacterium]